MVIPRKIKNTDAEVSSNSPRFACGKTAFPVLGRQNDLSFRVVQDGQNVDHFRSLGIIDQGSGVTRFFPVQMLLGAGISRLKIVIVQTQVLIGQNKSVFVFFGFLI